MFVEGDYSNVFHHRQRHQPNFFWFHYLWLTVVYHYSCPGGFLPLASRVPVEPVGFSMAGALSFPTGSRLLLFEREKESAGFPHDADGGVVHDV